ncbi:hypothetical protein M3210_18120 [Oceanobacillus luteolus]|uniref:hypothetical protein n=1 Tax=Oceanobacillus luteolus TaxID=1274358 RepID=UPI002040B82C|nr:hypothetical protein [Oceanobacillus luteolus]MCM3742153.1 hypothetical protein [Oceanobacillus luteolus]
MSKYKRIILIILFIPLVILVIAWIMNLFYPSSFTIAAKIYLGYLITLLSVSIACLLSVGKVEKRKYQLWGITIMLLISAPLAFSIGFTVAIIERDGFAALIMLFIFPILFIIGLILLLVGVFKKGISRGHSDLKGV